MAIAKIRIISDEGSIDGWFVSLCTTTFVFVMAGLGFFIESVRVGWREYGSSLVQIYVGSFGVWLAYRGWKYREDAKVEQSQFGEIKVVEKGGE